jgi:predicted oxidoreductase
MEKIYLSDAGPKVSPAIYGFWRWGKEKANSQQMMEKTIHLCLELGINTFDHADRYGEYAAEKLFGQILKQSAIQRSDLVLFSKSGVNVPCESKPEFRIQHYDSSAKHITQSVENSLKNLQTDYLDVYLLDHLDPLADLEATAFALQKLKAAGKIKNIGISGFSVHQHQLLASYLESPIVSNHIDLSLLNTDVLENGTLDYIKQKYMRPLAVSPLAGGQIEHGTDEHAIKVRKKLIEIAKKYNANLESIAVAWIIKLGALPLIGTLEENRIKNIVNSFQIELDQQDWYELYYASKPFEL